MATEIPTEINDITQELHAFQQFVAARYPQGHKIKIETCLERFRVYQEQRERCREEIRPALEASLRGESKPVDPEDLKERVRKRLAEKGIT